jgi:hypothetical protein
MDMIQYPIKFGRDGFVKLTDGSVDYFAQLLTISLLTEPYTHPFAPDFGSNDPSFRIIDKSTFVLNAAKFVPEVRITTVTIGDAGGSSGISNVTFSFEVLPA